MRQDGELRTAEQTVSEKRASGFWARAQELEEWMDEQDSAAN